MFITRGERMNNIMVCVTRQKTCQRLIDYGRALMESEEDRLFVIHVARENENFLGNREEGEALEFLYEKAKKAGASLTVERSSDVLKTLADIAEKNDVNRVVAGQSGENGQGAGFLDKLERRLSGKADLVVLPAVS